MPRRGSEGGDATNERGASLIARWTTHSGRSSARQARRSHGCPCSITMEAAVRPPLLRSASSLHVDVYAAASTGANFARNALEQRPVSRWSLEWPPGRRGERSLRRASAGTKPRTTSTKNPLKSHPTGTRHSTSDGAGGSAAGCSTNGWLRRRTKYVVQPERARSNTTPCARRVTK